MVLRAVVLVGSRDQRQRRFLRGDVLGPDNLGCGSGFYNGNEVTMKFDTGDINSLTAYEKKLVGEHERGHAYGLDHTFTGCRVMRQGTYKFMCSGSLPSANDVDGVEVVYPNY